MIFNTTLFNSNKQHLHILQRVAVSINTARTCGEWVSVKSLLWLWRPHGRRLLFTLRRTSRQKVIFITNKGLFSFLLVSTFHNINFITYVSMYLYQKYLMWAEIQWQKPKHTSLHETKLNIIQLVIITCLYIKCS